MVETRSRENRWRAPSTAMIPKLKPKLYHKSSVVAFRFASLSFSVLLFSDGRSGSLLGPRLLYLVTLGFLVGTLLLSIRLSLGFNLVSLRFSIPFAFYWVSFLFFCWALYFSSGFPFVSLLGLRSFSIGLPFILLWTPLRCSMGSRSIPSVRCCLFLQIH